MVVLMIFGILFTALYMWVQPYMMRSRDTKRITSILSYTNILDTYEKNFDTFPSNMGSGGIFNVSWYCLSEIIGRSDVAALGNEGKFSALRGETAHPPVDPTNQVAYALICPDVWSYIYSRLDYGQWGNNSQLALIVARLETSSAANYGTGADLTDSGKVSDIINAKKWSLIDTSSDQLYVVSKLH